MYGIIYLTECIDEEHIGLKYIGQHRCDSDEFDGYLGSGIRIRRLIGILGEDKFKRTTLERCDTKEDLDDREKYYISRYREIDPDRLLNLHDGGSGGWGYYNRSDHDHPRGMLGKHQTEYQRSHQSEIMKGNKIGLGKPRIPYKRSAETLRKLSLSLRGKVSGMKGKHLSEDSRRKLSASMKRHHIDHPENRLRISNKISLRNSESIWITNGTEDKFIPACDISEYPEYREGRSLISNKSKIGMIFINNGNVNKQIRSTDVIPEGWVRGMLKKSGYHKRGKLNEDKKDN